MADAEMREVEEEVGDREEQNPLMEAVDDAANNEAEPPAIFDSATIELGLKHHDEWSGTYTWRVENFSTCSLEKMYSENFEVASHYWRLLLFPQGNKGSKDLAAYLDAPEAHYTPLSMSPKARFKLHIINQIDGTRITKEATHTFTQSDADWGFSTFVPLDEVLNPKNGWSVGDAVVLQVDVTVQRDAKYSVDCRKETGCVGLKNQGATCYMNSLLQYMFHLTFLRNAVYHMPTSEVDEVSKCLPLALQSLFYKLQYSLTPVSTKDLTKSFGWGTYDAFMQHDVQELNRVLCEKLEEKMKGTKVERVINELFEGHTHNYIECINIKYKSSRKESFMDLQLDVKGCKDVYESFSRYVEVETLDGPNQYNAEGHGLQDAKKGVLFGGLPPVLQLQLKRFEYDFQRDAMIKINDRYEFPEELDLDFEGRKIFAPETDSSVRNLYRLHSVLVHSGGVHGGHYYSFIRPDGKRWLKFDDDHVDLVDAKKAMDDQFGGDDDVAPAYSYNAPAVTRFAKFSNAYMLVYVRDSDWPRMMSEVAREDIAEHLRERFEQEQREKEGRQKMKQEAHLYCTLKLATDKDLVEQVGTSGQYFDLVNHDRLPAEHVFRIKKNVRFSQFKADVQARLGVPVAAQRYWIWSARQNGTFRPSRPLTPEEEEVPLMELREHRDQRAASATSKQSLMDIKLFLEVPQKFSRELGGWEATLEQPLAAKAKSELLLFFKYYDPEAEQLRYVGRAYFSKNTKMMELYPLLCLMCGLPEGTELQVYEEVKWEPTVMVVPVEPKATLKSTASLDDGDILVVQRRLSKEAAVACRHASAPEYLAYIRNRRVVSFKRVSEPQEAGTQVELLRGMDYDQVTAELAKAIGVDDPEKLRLTQHSAYSHQPLKHPIKFRGIPRLENMLQHASHVNDVLYYEVLDMSLQELEKLKTLKVSFHNDKTELEKELTVRLPRDGTVADVLADVARQLGAACADKPLRLIEVLNGKLYKVVDEEEEVERLNDNYWSLRAEVVPEEERSSTGGTGGGQQGEAAQLISVCHFNQDKDSAVAHVTTFGDPFLLRIRNDERVADIRLRIQAKLGTPDEEFAKWRCAFVSVRGGPEFLEDPEELLGLRFARASTALTELNYLGLQHEDKAPRRPAHNANNHRSQYEKAIKINS